MFFALYYFSSTSWQGIPLLSSGQFSIFACDIPQQQGSFYWNIQQFLSSRDLSTEMTRSAIEAAAVPLVQNGLLETLRAASFVVWTPHERLQKNLRGTGSRLERITTALGEDVADKYDGCSISDASKEKESKYYYSCTLFQILVNYVACGLF